MGQFRTVLGDLDTEKMGFTMPHEHVLTDPKGGGTKATGEEGADHALNVPEISLAMCVEYKEAGGDTLVEATPKTWGRNTLGMVDISKASGVNLVACCGVICEEHGMDPATTGMSINDIADEMIHDITEGMDGTTSKAGWIKVGTAYMHITENEEKFIRAGARAATKTGVPLHAHTTNGTMGIEITEILQDEGYNMERMIIAHVDRNPDLWYHREMLKTGVYLIYDGPGKAKYYPDTIRIDLLRQLVADGYEDKLMICNDMGRRSHHKVYGGGPGLPWIKERFLPRLINDEGFDEAVVHKFMYENPHRIYTMVDPA